MNRIKMLNWCVNNLDEWPTNAARPSLPANAQWCWSGVENIRLHCPCNKYPAIHKSDWSGLRLPKPVNREEMLEWCVAHLKEWKVQPLDPVKCYGWEWVVMVGEKPLIHNHGGDMSLGYEDWEGVTGTPVSMLGGVESIELIASGLTAEQWEGFCFGNEMKYRFRAGKKDKLEQDIVKANQYVELFEKFKGLTRG